MADQQLTFAEKRPEPLPPPCRKRLSAAVMSADLGFPAALTAWYRWRAESLVRRRPTAGLGWPPWVMILARNTGRMTDDAELDALLPSTEGMARDALAINATVAGQAYRTIQVQQSQGTASAAVPHLWIPLVDGTERLGVMELEVSDASPAKLAWFKALASPGRTHGREQGQLQRYVRAKTRRTQEMALQAELVWAFLPPRTFATDRDPRGRDDGAGIRRRGRCVRVFNARCRRLGTWPSSTPPGMTCPAGLMASVAMASCRSTRRAGGALTEMVSHADHAITAQFGGNRFVTALLCHLDVGTGVFTWAPCGHPDRAAPSAVTGSSWSLTGASGYRLACPRSKRSTDAGTTYSRRPRGQHHRARRHGGASGDPAAHRAARGG